MHHDIHYYLMHYNYGGVFIIICLEMIGIPFPAETTLTVTGFAINRSVFSLVPLVFVAASANIVGSTIAYGLGRYFGRAVILRFGRRLGITSARLAKAEAVMEKYRLLVIFVAKYIVGIRVLIPYLAGINKMPFLRFSALNSLAALIWVTTFILLGQYAGRAWKHYQHTLDQYIWPIAAFIVLMIIIYVVIKKIRYDKK